ncbi:hypothetical protein P13BB106kb_p059 [Pectobacterium phage DU_PP_V]|uniref:Uncharacterized protein n=1 Tax=Pectobacterium phage DU_PP_V TaxID=2041492 RepID=A0A2D2W745_9CAUD|nr:hypothetical protein HOS40_gp110 [Pectobacterium phage DU_PP_V]ATS94043.1 hypothetical protein P13BB106kb_p059 [Pectobacterium phage DU_PP_V]
MRLIASGIESCLVTSWDGWDGDNEWMVFYSVVLTPEVLTELQDAEVPVDNSKRLDLEINLTNMVATISQYNDDTFEDVTSWVFQLQVVPKYVGMPDVSNT